MKSPPLLDSGGTRPFCSAPLQSGPSPNPRGSQGPHPQSVYLEPPDPSDSGLSVGHEWGSARPAPFHAPVLGVGAASSPIPLPAPAVPPPFFCESPLCLFLRLGLGKEKEIIFVQD